MTSLWEQEQARMGRDVGSDPAHQAHARAASQYQRVRANPHLSDAGRRTHIAKAYLASKAELDSIAAGEQATRANRISALQRQTFGAPRDPVAAMSWRQARALVADIGLDRRKAGWEMDRALRSGDSDYAKALAEHASENAWTDLVDQYAAATPGFAGALTELAQLTNPDPQRAMMRSLELMTPKPSELGTASDTQIESWATETAGQ